MFSLFNISSIYPGGGSADPICPYVRTPTNLVQSINRSKATDLRFPAAALGLTEIAGLDIVQCCNVHPCEVVLQCPVLQFQRFSAVVSGNLFSLRRHFSVSRESNLWASESICLPLRPCATAIEHLSTIRAKMFLRFFCSCLVFTFSYAFSFSNILSCYEKNVSINVTQCSVLMMFCVVCYII